MADGLLAPPSSGCRVPDQTDPQQDPAAYPDTRFDPDHQKEASQETASRNPPRVETLLFIQPPGGEIGDGVIDQYRECTEGPGDRDTCRQNQQRDDQRRGPNR